MDQGIDKFNQPAASQSSSRLLQLPSELRLSILGLLLKHENWFRTISYSQREELNRTVRDCTQMLLTCQLLYTEGRTIFYQQNPIYIDWEFRSGPLRPQASFRVLNLSVVVPRELGEMTSSQVDPIVHSRERNWASSWDPNTNALAAFYPTLKKFQHIRINAQYTKEEDLVVMCLVLRDIMINKDIEIEITFVESSQSLSMLVHESEVDRASSEINVAFREVNLASLRCWRSVGPLCRSLQVSSLYSTDPPQLFIKDSQPVHDLFSHYFELHAKIGWVIDTGGFMADHSSVLDNLRQCTIDGNLEGFLEAQSQTLTYAAKHNELQSLAITQQHEQNIMKVLEQAKIVANMLNDLLVVSQESLERLRDESGN